MQITRVYYPQRSLGPKNLHKSTNSLGPNKNIISNLIKSKSLKKKNDIFEVIKV